MLRGDTILIHIHGSIIILAVWSGNSKLFHVDLGVFDESIDGFAELRSVLGFIRQAAGAERERGRDIRLMEDN